jgi:hypothetical protein
LIVGERLAQARCGYDGYDKFSQRFGVSGWKMDSDSPDGVTSWGKAVLRAES